MREENPLREFVYLDEVSVTSLVSSRRGAVPSEITEKLSDTFKSGTGSEIGASGKVLTAKMGSVLESTRTEDRQVLRKATIQATFRDLLNEEYSSLVVRPWGGETSPPELNERRELIARASEFSQAGSDWIIGRDRLQRGRLIELDVELEPDPVFRVSAFVSSYQDLITDSSEFSGSVDQAQAATVRGFNEILERLLVGLVPLKCRLVDYEAVIIGNEEYLLHRSILHELPEAERPVTKPAYLVGITEKDLFWKDIRRILFSKARVRVLCRINYEGVQSRWNAVKLADMIVGIVPEFADFLNNFGNDVLRAMTSGADSSSQVNDTHVATLLAFSDLLAQEVSIAFDQGDRAEIRRLSTENSYLLATTLPESRPAFQAIVDYIQDRHGLILDPEIVHNLRERARRQVRFDAATSVANSTATYSTPSDERYVDCEIIAIYW